jgi:hypothetical protein
MLNHSNIPEHQQVLIIRDWQSHAKASHDRMLH